MEDKELLEKIFNWTFPGLTMYYRDTNLSVHQQSRYQIGMLLRNGFFIDVANTAGKPTQNTRFVIASSKAAPVHLINPETTKWGMHVINTNSYFKVLDIYEVENYHQIFLLHIPAKGLDFFGNANSNLEEQIISKARESFNSKFNSSIMPVFQEAEWIEKTSFAIGIDEKDNYFPLKPTPLPSHIMPLFEGLKKFAKDTDDINVYIETETDKKQDGFWKRLFN